MVLVRPSRWMEGQVPVASSSSGSSGGGEERSRSPEGYYDCSFNADGESLYVQLGS